MPPAQPKPVKVSDLDDLVNLLMNLKISEDEATRWAGKARTQGVVLIAGVERTEAQCKKTACLAKVSVNLHPLPAN